VSIAGKAPNWYKGKEYKKLAPKYWFFKKFKEDGDETFYKEQYQKEVLDTLNPKEIYENLKDSTLICWETKGKFCHRRLVAEWLENKLNINIPEL
jgi:uncharacterized protein (DUF488 family)